MAYQGCNIMVGLLEPQGDSIRFGDVGDRPAGWHQQNQVILHRGEGVSFRALDKGDSICLTGLTTNHHYAALNTPLPPQCVPKPSSEGGGPKGFPLVIVPLDAGGCRVGVLAVDRFSIHDEERGWEDSRPRADDVTSRRTCFYGLKGNELRTFKVWRHPHVRTEGARQDAPPFSNFCSSAMVCGHIVDVTHHPRWGAYFTVLWEDGLQESNISAKVLDEMINLDQGQLGRGAFLDQDIIDKTREVAIMMGQVIDKVRKDTCIKELQGLTKRFTVSVDDIYQAGLQAVVSQVLMNRLAEVWEVKRVSDISYDIEAIARIDSAGTYTRANKNKRALEDLSRSARRVFFEKVFRENAQIPAFAMPEASEIIVAPYHDQGEWQRFAKTRTIKLFLVSAHKLAVAKKGVFGVGRTDPFCIIRHCGREIKRTSVKPNTCNPRWDDPDDEEKNRIFFTLPAEPWDVQLVIEVWDMGKTKESLFLGRVALHMEDLLFPTRGVKEYELQGRPGQDAIDAGVVQGKIGLYIRAQDKRGRSKGGSRAASAGVTPNATSSSVVTTQSDGTSKQTCSTASSLYSKGMVSVVRVHSCQGLLIKDVKMTGILVIMKWNGEEVGRTPTSKSLTAPSWDNADYRVKVRGDPVVSSLTFELWLSDATGPKQRVGHARIMSDTLETSRGKLELLLEPEMMIGVGIRSERAPIGTLVVSCDSFVEGSREGLGYDDASQSSLSDMAQSVITSSSKPITDNEIMGGGAAATATSATPAAVPPSKPLQQAPPKAREALQRIVVTLHKAIELPRVEFFNKPEPYCMVKCNGTEIGRTEVCGKTFEPVFGDSDNGCRFYHDIPGTPQDLDVCIEMWSMTKNPPGTFLGQVLLSREELYAGKQNAAHALQDAYTKKPMKGELYCSYEMTNASTRPENRLNPQAAGQESTPPGDQWNVMKATAEKPHRTAATLLPNVENDDELPADDSSISLKLQLHWVGGFGKKIGAFCLISWDGKAQAKTKPILDATSEIAAWKDECFVLPLETEDMGGAQLLFQMLIGSDDTQGQDGGGEVLGEICIPMEVLCKEPQQTEKVFEMVHAGRRVSWIQTMAGPNTSSKLCLSYSVVSVSNGVVAPLNRSSLCGISKFKVLDAQGLAKLDPQNDPNPFCIVKWNGVEVGRSQVVYYTVDPIWDGVHVDLSLEDAGPMSVVVVEVWAVHLNGVLGDFLGQATIPAEDLQSTSGGERQFPLTSKPGMKKSEQKHVQGKLTVCWHYEPMPGEKEEDDYEEDEIMPSSRPVMYALIATRAPTYTWPADVHFLNRIGPELSTALFCVRGRNARVQERKLCLAKLKAICDKWQTVPYKRILASFRYIIERCLPSCDGYLGIVQKGGKAISYIESSRYSKMIGQRLNRGQGVSFDAVLELKSLVFQEKDFDVPPTPNRFQPGDTCRIRYGRVFYPGKIVRWAGQGSYDVIYDLNDEKEAAVKADRIIWVPPCKRVPYKFPTAGQLGYPYVCVPVRHGSAVIGKEMCNDSFLNSQKLWYDAFLVFGGKYNIQGSSVWTGLSKPQEEEMMSNPLRGM